MKKARRIPKSSGNVKRTPRDISSAERKRILARIEFFGRQAARTKEDIRGVQQHCLAVNRFARALARELIRKGVPVDYKKVSRASLWHDVLRQRTLVTVDFRTGKVRPSKLLGSEERTVHSYMDEFDEKAAIELLKRSKNPREREVAKVLTSRKWMRYNKPKAREHITLEQLIVDLGDSAVEGRKFVPMEKRFEALERRMKAYTRAERRAFKRAFNQMRQMARERIEQKYGIDIGEIIERLQKTRG